MFERRVDGDGKAYTFSQFEDFYGEEAANIWSTCRSEANGKRKRHFLGSKGRRSARKVMSQLDTYFEREYGARWPALRGSLLQPVSYVARINGFADAEKAIGVLPPARERATEFTCLAFTVQSGHFPLPQHHLVPARPSLDETACLEPYYLMDGASVAAALALEVAPGHRVLGNERAILPLP